MGRAQGSSAPAVALGAVVARRRPERSRRPRFRPAETIHTLNTWGAQRHRLAQLTRELSEHEADQALERSRADVQALLAALDADEADVPATLDVIRDQAEYDLHTHITVANHEGRRLTTELVADGASFSMRVAVASVIAEVAQADLDGTLQALDLDRDEVGQLSTEAWFDSLRAALGSEAPATVLRQRLTAAADTHRVASAVPQAA